MNWPICNTCNRLIWQPLRWIGFSEDDAKTNAEGARSLRHPEIASARPKFSPERKDALESQVRLLDISASIWNCDATVHLPGRSSVFFDSGVRLFRQQRGESFALRHDA